MVHHYEKHETMKYIKVFGIFENAYHFDFINKVIKKVPIKREVENN